MVNIYTKKGDDGTTSLWYGGRVPKSDPRTEAYGTLDEAASVLGVARSLCKPTEHDELSDDILKLQNDLFVAGAELATAPAAAERLEDGVSRISDEMADSLDAEVDRYLAGVELPPQFTIPGGTQLSAQLDVARAVLRRAERRVVALNESGELASAAILRFLNRASDLLFAMARATDEDSPARFAGRSKE
ncbi:MAG: cob(I)yrinic acid a,c-diamide adenosyltransferase [Actinomycetota bacterium]|nr:cob(I)yrinic acid a,c-diamide adenosyltransferase [Actinomycetota bacterium]